MDGQAIPVTAALIVRDGLVLVARKPPGGPRAGRWEFPGGKVEPGEQDEAALRRELAEELGVEVSVGRMAESVRWEYADVAIELRAYWCTITRGEPQAHEHAALAWVSGNELGGLALCDADAAIAGQVVESREGWFARGDRDRGLGDRQRS